jgi:ABC transporter substrate binding protein
MRRIGVLMGTTDEPVGQGRVRAFRQGLQELKWIEGVNIRIDLRWGAGDAALIKAQAAEIVGLAPDVILGINTPVLRALKEATQTIPVVFAGLADPVGEGIDTADFSGLRSNYTVTKSGSSNYVATDTRGGTPDGVDVVTNTELFGFSNVRLSAENFTPVSLNGDVRSDLVWQDTNGNATAYLMNGTGINIAIALGNFTTSFRIVGTGDLNGDGKSDIVLQGSNGQAIGLIMDGLNITSAGALGGSNGTDWFVVRGEVRLRTASFPADAPDNIRPRTVTDLRRCQSQCSGGFAGIGLAVIQHLTEAFSQRRRR